MGPDHRPRKEEAWCIATDRTDLGAAGVVQLYARRFTIEETFRDIKDNHFGSVRPPDRTRSTA